MPYTTCPGCDDEMYIPGRPRVGTFVTCKTCEAELEVVEVNPLELDWRQMDDDDDDDYDDDDDDDD